MANDIRIPPCLVFTTRIPPRICSRMTMTPVAIMKTDLSKDFASGNHGYAGMARRRA
jgi:hypothetical protein